MATNTSRSRWNKLWYETVRFVLWIIGLVYFRVRCRGTENVPNSGGALLLANHQSHLDPPLIGMMIPPQINYLARETLFKNRFFGAFIRSIGSIPIDRDGMGIGGIKATLRCLKRGEMVLMFPEGTRSPDGNMQPLKPGFAALAKRGGVPLVPIGIDGAFQAFPRGKKFPRPGRVRIVIGPPIETATAQQLDDDALVALVEERLRECWSEARALR